MSTSWTPPSSQTWESSPATAYVPPKRTEPAAVVAFLLALSSFVIWMVPAIVALFVAPGAKRNVVASNGAGRGKGLAIASQVLAVLSLLGSAAILTIAALV